MAGIVLLIVGVTGALLIFEEPIDHALNPGLMVVQPRGSQLPVSALIAGVEKAYPGVRAGMIMLPKQANWATTVLTRSRTGTGTVYVDPYTGRVLGKRQGRGFMPAVHQMHMRLLLGKTGDMIVSISALALMFLALSGIILWWPLKRVTVAVRKSWRRFNFDLHHAIGFYSSLFLLPLAFTGVMIGFEDSTVPAMYRITNSEPLAATLPSTPVKGATPISPDQAMAIAQAALPGTHLIGVMLPAGPKGSYRVALAWPEDLTPGGRSRVLVDQFSGKVLLVESSRTAPAGTRLVILNRAIHTGDIGGWPTKILACLVSLSVVAQALSGLVMWWKRRPSSKSSAPAEAQEVAI